MADHGQLPDAHPERRLAQDARRRPSSLSGSDSGRRPASVPAETRSSCVLPALTA